MNRSALIPLGLLTLIALIAWSRAQSPESSPAANPRVVGALGSPEMIDFVGNAAFTPRALRQGLSGLPEFLLAAHPAAPLDDFLALVRHALERGYRNEGFLKAAVNVGAEGGRVRVSVTEGPRYRCGELQLEGLQRIPAADVLRELTSAPDAAPAARSLEEAIDAAMKSQRPAAATAAEATLKGLAAAMPVAGIATSAGGLTGPGDAVFQNQANALFSGLAAGAATTIFWERDRPAPVRDGFAGETTTRVKAFLAARGYALADVKATLVPDDAARRVHLRIEINEGPLATLGRITVVGAKRNTPEEIIQHAGLAPGVELTPAALSRAKVALWNSTRFYSFDFQPQPGTTPGAPVDLILTVQEIGDRPPLREPLSATDTALVKFANWVTAQAARQEIAFGVSFPKGTFAIALSPTQGVAAVTTATSGERLGIHIGPAGTQVLAAAAGQSARREFGPLGKVWTFQASLLMQEPKAAQGRDSNLFLGASWQSRSDDSSATQIRFELAMAPAFACEKLADEADAALEGGEVILRNKQTRRVMVRFREDTGELLEWALSRPTAVEPEATPAEFRVTSETFGSVAAQFRAEWDGLPPDAGKSSMVAAMAGHPWLRLLLENEETDRSMKSALARLTVAARMAEAILGSPEFAAWWDAGAKDDTGPSFSIPTDPARAGDVNAIAAMMGAMYYQLSTLLWPVDTWPAKAAREIFYVITGNTKYTAAVLDELYRDPRMGPMGSIVIAQLLRNHDPRASLRFARRALNRGTAESFRQDWNLLLDPGSGITAVVQRTVRALAALPEAEVEAMLGELDAREAALVRRGFAELRRQPDRPVAAILQPILDEWWTTHVEPSLENRIGELLAGDKMADAAIVAFTVNGEPVHRKLLRQMSPSGQLRPSVPIRPGDAGRPPAEVARDALIDLMLLEREFAAGGEFIRADFLDTRVAALVKSGYGGDWERFTANLNRNGLTLADQREILRLQEISRLMQARLVKDVPPPTPAEIQVAARNLPATAETRTLQAILVPKAARATAEQIRAEAVQAGTFEGVWARHDGRDPAQPRRTLLANVLRRDLASREIADAAFALAPGEISPVVESGDLCYILHLVSRDEHDTPAEKRERAANVARTRKQGAAVLAHIDRLRAQSIVRLLDDPARKVVNATLPARGSRIEFESLKVLRASKTRVMPTTMTNTGGAERWSGGRTLTCASDADGWAEWNFTVPSAGLYRIGLLAVRGMNQAQVQAVVDGQKLGRPVELHAAVTQPSGVLTLGEMQLAAGLHQLRFTVAGKHPSSLGHNFGLDAIDLVPLGGAAAAAVAAVPASAPDLIEILSVTPLRAEAGKAQKFRVRLRYALGSVPRGILRLGFNTADSKSFRMVAQHKVEQGSGEAELTATVTPKVWSDGTRFSAYVNLSADPHPPRWTPLATHTRAIQISPDGKSEASSR